MSELKDLLKPPFTFYCGRIYSNGENTKGVLIENPVIGEFIAAAMNEKAEREWGKPLQWVYTNGFWQCRKCGTGFSKWSPHCPACGVKLNPPEE